MSTCGDLPRRPAEQGSTNDPARGKAWSPRVEGISGPGTPARIDVQPVESAPGDAPKKVLRHPQERDAPKEMSEGSTRRSDGPLKDAAALSPTAATPQRWQSVDPKPGARRQARNCRRLDGRKVVRRPRDRRSNAPVKGIQKSDAGGFSHGAGQTSSEGGVSAGPRDAKRRL